METVEKPEITDVNSEKMQKLKVQNRGAIMCLLGFFVIVALLFFKEPPVGNKDLLNFVMGSLTSVIVPAMMYYLFQYKRNPDDRVIPPTNETPK